MNLAKLCRDDALIEKRRKHRGHAGQGRKRKPYILGDEI